jgi:hypothetical protein
LSHRNVNTTAIYARLNTDPVRDAMNKATQAIWEAGNFDTLKNNITDLEEKSLNS